MSWGPLGHSGKSDGRKEEVGLGESHDSPGVHWNSYSEVAMGLLQENSCHSDQQERREFIQNAG